MKQSLGSLIALTLACTVAATIFGFGSEVFSWRSVYRGLGREELIQATRLFVYVALGVLLAFRGGWPGVLAAIVMATAATPRSGRSFPSPTRGPPSKTPQATQRSSAASGVPLTFWTTYDILGVGISAALAQGLRMMAHVNPRGHEARTTSNSSSSSKSSR